VARHTLALIEPVLADPDVTPLRRGLCEAFIAWFYVNVPHESRAQESIERLNRLGMEQELPRLRSLAAIVGYWLGMSHLRAASAARWLKLVEEVMDRDNAYDVGCLLGLKAWSSLVGADVTTALSLARDAAAAFEEAGSAWHRILSRAMLGWAYSEANDYIKAEQASREALALGRQMNIDLYHVFVHQLHAVRYLAA